MATPITHCRRCGQMLTDPGSIRNGIGPECQEKEAELAAFPIGAEVEVTAGLDQGRKGTVIAHSTRRPDRPVMVRFLWSNGYFAPNQVQLVSGGAA